MNLHSKSLVILLVGLTVRAWDEDDFEEGSGVGLTAVYISINQRETSFIRAPSSAPSLPYSFRGRARAMLHADYDCIFAAGS